MSDEIKKPAVPVWHCQFKPLEGPNAVPLTSLTVGAKFEMDCNGDIGVIWNGKPEINLPEKTPEYSLYILAAPRLDTNSVELVVTSYRPGQAKPEFVRVMTGDAGFETTDLEWNVQSVVKQGEQPKPFGPFGPYSLALPGWVWLILALVLAAVFGSIWIWFSKRRKRRRLRDELAKFSLPAVTSSAQFHKELRQLSRKLVSAKDTKASAEWNASLDQSLRVYLMREFKLLTLNTPRSRLFLGFKRRDRQAFDRFAEGLQKIFSEMDRFQSHAEKHRPGDFEQILQIARKWCDEMEKVKVKRV